MPNLPTDFCVDIFLQVVAGENRNRRDRDGGYFPASRQASKWPGVGHQTCLKRLPDCSSSAPPQIGQVSPATNAEARVSTFSPNWFRFSFLSVADWIIGKVSSEGVSIDSKASFEPCPDRGPSKFRGAF